MRGTCTGDMDSALLAFSSAVHFSPQDPEVCYTPANPHPFCTHSYMQAWYNLGVCKLKLSTQKPTSKQGCLFVAVLARSTCDVGIGRVFAACTSAFGARASLGKWSRQQAPEAF